MKMMNVEKLLRQNRPHKDGSPGSWKLRLALFPPGMVQQRVEIGLGTTDRETAKTRAMIAIRALLAVAGLPREALLRLLGIR